MTKMFRHRTGTLLAICAVPFLLLGAATSQAADADSEAAAGKVIELLSRNFYEVEFFVFERSDVMEFNTREVLVHRRAQPYPYTMLALRSADEPFGSDYLIDANTRLCLTYPTLEYTLPEPDQGQAQGAESGIEPADANPIADTLPGDTPEDISVQPPELTLAAVIDPEAELREAVAAFEAQLLERSATWADPDTYQLSRAASQVRRRVNGRILFHGRWLQAVPERDSPMPVYIRGGSQFGHQQELLGSVGVTLGRYLHFQAELNYNAPALGAYPTELASRADGSGTAVPASDATDGFMTLAQSRRMRSGELHYLDHPKLGIVVRIDPVEIPQSLIDLQLALEESE